jgi:hypothetical protein
MHPSLQHLTWVSGAAMTGWRPMRLWRCWWSSSASTRPTLQTITDARRFCACKLSYSNSEVRDHAEPRPRGHYVCMYIHVCVCVCVCMYVLCQSLCLCLSVCPSLSLLLPLLVRGPCALVAWTDGVATRQR